MFITHLSIMTKSSRTFFTKVIAYFITYTHHPSFMVKCEGHNKIIEKNPFPEQIYLESTFRP